MTRAPVTRYVPIMTFERRELSESEQAMLRERIASDLRVLDDIVLGSERLRRASLLGALWGGFARVVGFAASGPDTWYAPGASPWLRPANIAGSGCVVLFMFILLAVACVIALLVEYPLPLGVAIGVLLLVTLRALFLRSARRKALALHLEQATRELNRIELERSGAEEPRPDASARVHVAFTVIVSDSKGRTQPFLGEGLWLLCGGGVQRHYLVVRADEAQPRGEALREARQALYDELGIREHLDRLQGITELPAGFMDFESAWRLKAR